MIFHFYTTITQNTSVYQNIWVAGYSDWYVIVNVAYIILIIWPISQDNFISSMSYCRSDICFVVVKFEFTILFYNFESKLKYIALSQLYLDLCFTTKCSSQ